MDLVYVKGPVCTAFFPVSKEGEVAWKAIAEKTDGTGKVFNSHLESALRQIREAGYSVSEMCGHSAMGVDQIAQELSK